MTSPSLKKGLTASRSFSHPVREARPDDDAGIRQLLQSSAMPSDIRIAMTREPSFFSSTAVEGRKVRVAVAESTPSGPPVGLIMRSEKEAYVNGEPRVLGYLGGLRVQPVTDRIAILRQGADFVAQCHGEGGAGIYIQTVTDGNSRAAGLLMSGRLGMPRLRDLGRLHTFLLNPKVFHRLQDDSSYEIRMGKKEDLPAIVDFLQSGKRRQFFPIYRNEDFGEGGGLLRGLFPEQILMAFKDNQLIGTLGLWNQTDFKQIHITSYSTTYKLCRNFLNLVAHLGSRPSLPPAGDSLRHFKTAILCIEQDDPSVFAQLLRHALLFANQSQPPLPLAIMVHDRDAFLPLLRSLPSIVYSSRLFTAYYKDGVELVESLDDRVPYVELGAL
jgi:hypothetical protein